MLFYIILFQILLTAETSLCPACLSNLITNRCSLVALLQPGRVDSARKENILGMSILQAVGIIGMVTSTVCERYTLSAFIPHTTVRSKLRYSHSASLKS